MARLYIVLIGDGQFVAIIRGVVLYQRINHGAFGGEIWDHVGRADNELSVKDVVVGIVAMVHHEGEIDHESCRVALAVGAGVRFIGWHTVVGQKLCFALTVDDDTSAGAFHVRSDIDPSAYRIQCLILHRVRRNRNRVGQNRPVGVFGVFLASVQQRQERY